MILSLRYRRYFILSYCVVVVDGNHQFNASFHCIYSIFRTFLTQNRTFCIGTTNVFFFFVIYSFHYNCQPFTLSFIQSAASLVFTVLSLTISTSIVMNCRSFLSEGVIFQKVFWNIYPLYANFYVLALFRVNLLTILDSNSTYSY